jgi:hypothetical protein
MNRHSDLEGSVARLFMSLKNNVDNDYLQLYFKTIDNASKQLDKITKLEDIGIEWSDCVESFNTIIFDGFSTSQEFLLHCLDKNTFTIHCNDFCELVDYDVDASYFNEFIEEVYIIDKLNIYLGLVKDTENIPK